MSKVNEFGNDDVNVSFCQDKKLSINVPDNYNYNDKEVLFKIQKKKTDQKIQKFRSFNITVFGNYLQIKDKKIHVMHLFTILKERGLSATLPVQISLGELTINNFDWNPQSYGGPTVWDFKWDNIDCSITGTNMVIYIRVHDLTLGVGERVLKELSNELLTFWQNPVPNQSLLIYTTQRTIAGHQWIQNCSRLRRNMNTIYMDKHIKSQLINQLTKFYGSSDMYDLYGVTWKRVHLFHGPPGSGKTSTILALASIFGKNISKLTLTPDLNSQDIERLFQTIPNESFLLLEDVDALFTERKSNTSIDFSTLLNCVDALTTRRGLVLFMTTNHVTQLDSAFVRPGRVDICVEFKLPGKDELYEALTVLGANYVHEHEEFLNKCSNGMSIAQLQKHLFDCIMEEKESILF